MILSSDSDIAVPELLHTLLVMAAASWTASAPQPFPMHCETAISQELVPHRQLSSKVKQLLELQVLARVHCWVLKTLERQLASQSLV
jgi:hypothetical protein